jgi:alpha-glucosidase
MRDVAIAPDRVQDPWERRVPGLGRDPVRTPIRWTEDGGFTTSEPWLPLGDTRSVAEQERDADSLLLLYRRLLALRRAEDALTTGDLQLVRAEDGVLAYTRGGTFLVALNLTPEERALDGPAGELRLAGDEARIVRLG